MRRAPGSFLPEVRTAAVGTAFLPLAHVAGHLGAGPGITVTAFAAICGLTALGLRAAYAVLLSLSAWAALTGFVVNDLGRLTFTAADLARLGLLVGVSLVCRWAGQDPVTVAAPRPPIGLASREP